MKTLGTLLFVLLAGITTQLHADEASDLRKVAAIQQNQLKEQSLLIQTQGKQIQDLLNSLKTSLAIKGSVDFGADVRQMVNLWNQEYGIGIQWGTEYFRTGGNFAFYKGGAHHNDTFNSGGGTTLMTIDGSGTVAANNFVKNGRSVLTYVGCSLYKKTLSRPDDMDRCEPQGGQMISGNCYMVSCSNQ
ncbi:MAG TPA: hypothetical protein VE954_34910 [Oligoflexus sp.]|uniref:hypothetical protein n=1 Tax=Oligoflexus sp. TaxID=1971216 RepID=UPI002D673246|nr:hypothetical protein [Oligoflexus sp.]HYX38322.1 hypothetical protein [Oligoflexus sp.]